MKKKEACFCWILFFVLVGGLLLSVPRITKAQSLALSTSATQSATSFSATQSAVIGSLNQEEPWYDAYLTLIDDETQQTLLVEPTRIGDDYSLALNPGETRQLQFTLTNSSEQSYYVRTLIRDFIVGSDGETPLLVEGDNLAGNYALSNWLTIGREWTYLKPHSSTKIFMTLRAPNDASAGGYYAMLLEQAWESSPETQALDPAANPPPAQIGALIYVVVNHDQLVEKLKINDFKFDPFREQGPVGFSFEVNNQSNYHLRPTGSIVISDWLKKEVAVVDIPAQNIFPETTRLYGGTFDHKWGIGRYTATLILDGEFRAQTSFWLFPIRLVILVILVLLATSIFFYTDQRKNKKTKK